MVVFALALFVIGTVTFGLKMSAERGIVSRLDHLDITLSPMGDLLPKYLKLSKQSFNLTLVFLSLLFLR